jgi:protein MpaA
MERLRKNLGRYHGEMIDIDALQRDADRLAKAADWERDTFLDIPEITLRAYRRPSPKSGRNIYISAGIHGDEPSGPVSVLRFLEENRWPDANLWLVPCLNPTGFRRSTRENADGVDLNRDYRHITTPEVKAHTEWLQDQPPFDLTLLLHEDWEANGFYVYEVNPENRLSFAEPMVEAVSALCPIETAELVDNFTCNAGIIRPAIKPEDRPQWAEAIYLIVNKSRQSYTVETPSDYPLASRVKAHVSALKRVFEILDGMVP